MSPGCRCIDRRIWTSLHDGAAEEISVRLSGVAIVLSEATPIHLLLNFGATNASSPISLVRFAA